METKEARPWEEIPPMRLPFEGASAVALGRKTRGSRLINDCRHPSLHVCVPTPFRTTL